MEVSIMLNANARKWVAALPQYKQGKSASMQFAMITAIGMPYLRAEYTWDTVARTLADGGSFEGIGTH